MCKQNQNPFLTTEQQMKLFPPKREICIPEGFCIISGDPDASVGFLFATSEWVWFPPFCCTFNSLGVSGRSGEADRRERGPASPASPSNQERAAVPEARATGFHWHLLWTLSLATVTSVKQHQKQSMYKKKMFEVLVHILVLFLWGWGETSWPEYTVEQVE